MSVNKVDKKNYHPEPYWSKVANRIASREDKNVIAGDDEPFYRYKRRKFLKMLDEVDFAGKTVLEVGHGPGGNLAYLYGKKPKKLVGADISQDMINLATKNLEGKDIELVKTNGTKLPFEDNTFDIVMTVTVLQHNTNEQMLHQLIGEISRVAKSSVVIFEQTNVQLSGDELCHWRPVEYYQKVFAEHGLSMTQHQFINIYTSYLVCGAIRKGLNPSSREEGEKLNAASLLLENILLPVTSLTDKLVPKKHDLTKMVFEKIL